MFAIVAAVTGYLEQFRLGFIVQNKYLLAATIFMLLVLASKLLQLFVNKYITFLTRKTKTDLDDKLLEATKNPLFLLFTLFSLIISLSPLSLPEKASSIVNDLLFSIVSIVLIVVAIRATKIFLNFWGEIYAKKTKTTLDDDILPLLRKTLNIIIVIVGSLIILRIFGVNITGLLAGLGIAGLALGLGLQDSLSNIFGGVFLIIDRNLKLGDRIKLDSGEIGEVLDIGLRSTKIKTPDNELVVIPNGLLAKSKIQNLSQPTLKARFSIPFSVEYGAEVENVRKVVNEAVKNIRGLAKDENITILFQEMASSSLNFTCYLWAQAYNDVPALKSEATERIYNALNKAKINIPYPTQTIYLKK